MTRFKVASALLACLLVGSVTGSARADGERIPVNVLISHVSNQPGGIDAAAMPLDKQLRRNQLPFKSIRVLKEQRIVMTLDEVSRFSLPNGKAVRIRPIHKGESGVLMAVDVEGAAKLDARVKSHKPLVIRAGPYEKGSLVLSLELDY